MTKKAYVNWSIWIALIAGVYTALYLASPLSQYGVVWATFVALPIFFTSGGETKEIPNYLASNVAGVAWAMVDFWLAGLLAPLIGGAVANGIACFVVTTLLCAIHFVPTAKTWFNKPACMFGGFASAFGVGSPFGGTASWAQIGVLCVTLMFGVILVALMNGGLKLLDADGSWKLFSKKRVHNVQG